MRYIKLLVASVFLVSMSACVADNESDLEGYIKTINVIGPDKITFEPISGIEQTKATSVDAGSALVFKWAVGDTLGIFPNKGGQVEFPITSQESSTSATFDGGGWALRNNASYAAYYPFNVWNCHLNNKTIMLDYSGQVQNGNSSFDHLSAYDFLASAKTTPQNNMVTFQMDRQGSILYIDIVVPEPAAITSLTISCDEAIFVEKAALDISGNTPVVTPVETKASLTLNFENTATTYQYEIVRAYMAVQPLDFSAKTVTATLRTSAGIYTAPVVSRVVNKGKAAFLRFSDSFTAPTTPEAVDLGLPSGLKWASCNVGANSPEEYGDYFAWGATAPQESYLWETCPFRTSGDWDNVKFSKYNTKSDYGPIDNNTVLDPEDDAAAANWGGTWRMPTLDEWVELWQKCTWTWTTQNGVNGRLVTGPNGNSIFLPAAGDRDDTNLYDAGSVGCYWSSSLSTDFPNCACYVIFNSDGVYWGNSYRYSGQSVRPVTDEGVRVSVTGISLDKSSIELAVEETEAIIATVSPTDATQKNVIWSSSNTSVATVDYTGKVTAVSTSSTTITATTYDGGLTATCSVDVKNIHTAVDLGLSVKWGTFDLGADGVGAFGDVYSWGELEPWTESTTWQDYSYDKSPDVLPLSDDVANVKLGGNWRMPTEEETKELVANCTVTYETVNSVSCLKLTSKKNGQSIYLPRYRFYNNRVLPEQGDASYFWTSSIYASYTGDAVFYGYDSNHTSNPIAHYNRYGGFAIRPVWSDNSSDSQLVSNEPVDLGLGIKWASCNLGANSPE